MIPRHYLCPSREDPGRRRLIVRDGELLIGFPNEVIAQMTPDELEGLQEEEDILHGAGIEQLEGKPAWRAHVPGFGYLELEKSGVPYIIPAVSVSPDHLVAYLDLRSPTGDERAIQFWEIYQAIRDAGIEHGLSTSHVKAAWSLYKANGCLPCPMRIATGTRPGKGSLARLDWDIDVERHVGQVESKNDRIDFYERHFVCNVRAGQRLAVWSPGIETKPGRGVDGVKLYGSEQGPLAKLRVGKNIEVKEHDDGTSSLQAAVDGMLVFDNNGVPRVSDALEVQGDVSLETGNIDAMGSVVVHGAVRSELRVTATGSLKVHGMIEAADVEVGGNVIVKAGIVGDETSVIVAGGDVSCRYSQNARIRSGGDVRILDFDTTSAIECKGKLTATEGKGRLRGGEYRAGTSITAKEAGSELGVPTLLSVGAAQGVSRELWRAHGALQEVRIRLARCRHDLRRDRKVDAARESARLRRKPKLRRTLVQEEDVLRRRLRRLERKCGRNEQCSVTVLTRVYHGVRIIVNGRQIVVKGNLPGRRFFLDPYTRKITIKPL